MSRDDWLLLRDVAGLFALWAVCFWLMFDVIPDLIDSYMRWRNDR